MDEQTINLARHGDRSAQAKLLDALADTWYRLAVAMLRDPELARDAAQECALRLLSDLPRFRGDSSIRTFAVGIGINVVREFRRSRSRMRLVPEEFDAAADGPTALEKASTSEQQVLLRQLLADLPERQREALLLRFFEDLSVDETAKAMACAPGTIKATVHQALRSLKQKIAGNRVNARPAAP